jgi:hypothetical protein
MTQFLTLEEFMICDKNSYYKTGEQWLCWYALAKQSFELFGENGPETGSNVLTLVNGHCGMGNDRRIFNGSHDDIFFKLSRRNDDHYSLVDKTKWWKEVVPEDISVEVPIFVRKRMHRTNVELMTEFIVRG